MDMQIVRNNVAFERLISEANEQTVVEGEVALPGGIRDEAHILHTDARLTIDDTQILNDRLAVNGTVVFQILYTQGDAKPRALEASSAFTHQMPLPGVDSHARLATTGDVLEARSQAVSGRLLLHAALAINARALMHTPLAVVSGVNQLPGLESKTSSVTLTQHVGEAASTTMLREEFDLPASSGISETLYARAYPFVRKVHSANGSVDVGGDLSIDAYHVSTLPDKPLTITHHVIPFEVSMPISASEDEEVNVRVGLKDIAVSSVDAGEGARVLRAEGLIQTSASASREDTVETLADAYTLSGDMVQLTRESVAPVAREIATQSVQSGKLMFELPDDAAPVRSVLAAYINPIVADSSALGDRQRVTGVLHSTVVYLPFGGDAPVSASADTPFEALFQGALPANAWISVDAQEVEPAAITADRIELSYRMCMDANGYELDAASLPTDVTAQAVPVSKGGIVIVYPGQGETLWDLARKYRVTQDSIQKINPNLKAVQTGKPVLVFQRQRA
ncbi:peptidase M23 [Clostridia bacterium]|nr:peptidase M23 [Clostridia bacterium]